MKPANTTWWSPFISSIGTAAVPVAAVEASLLAMLAGKPTVLPGSCRKNVRRGRAPDLLAEFRTVRTAGVVSCFFASTGPNSCIFVDSSVCALDHTFLYELSDFCVAPLWRFAVTGDTRGFAVVQDSADTRTVWLSREGKWTWEADGQVLDVEDLNAPCEPYTAIPMSKRLPVDYLQSLAGRAGCPICGPWIDDVEAAVISWDVTWKVTKYT